MPYIDYKAMVKNAQIKKDGIVEIKLEANVGGLNGQFNHLSEMVGEKVDIGMEGTTVTFNVTVNAENDRPIREYKVNQDGVVEEVKPSHEQLKADDDLGLPEEDIPTKEEEKELDREKVDEFIKQGLAPNYDDLPEDFANIVKRRLEGDTYLKLANELDISSGQIVKKIDEYRKRVAPLAEKWWEWKESQESDYVSGDYTDQDIDSNKNDKEQDEDDDSQEGAA